MDDALDKRIHLYTEEDLISATNALCDVSMTTHRHEYSCIIEDTGQSLFDVAKILAKAVLDDYCARLTSLEKESNK